VAVKKLLKPIKGKLAVYRRTKCGSIMEIEKITVRSEKTLEKKYKELLDEYKSSRAAKEG